MIRNIENQRGSVIDGETPSLNDFTRLSVFDAERNRNDAFMFAGPEGINVSQRRKRGDDLSVVQPGNVPMVDPLIRFWDAVGMPISPNICVGADRAVLPAGYRLNLGAYSPRHDDGSLAAMRELLKKTLTKGDFFEYADAAGFGHLIPKTHRFAGGEKPEAAWVEDMLRRFKKAWMKPGKEILADHQNHPVLSVAEFNVAYGHMDGAPYVVQQHVGGQSYAIGYTVTEDGTVLPTYAGLELVENGFQYALEQNPKYQKLRRFTDDLTQHFADQGWRGPISWGLMYDDAADTEETFGENGDGFLIDNNMRAGGGESVHQLGEKARKIGGAPAELTAEFHYEYVEGHYSGPELLDRVRDSRRWCPNPETLDGLWVVGLRPNGGGKLVCFGKNARARFQEAKDWFRLYVPEH